MANKFLTTQNKKIIATVGLVLSGWFVLTSGGNPLSLPEAPSMITNPLFGSFSLLTIAGVITLLTVFMLWTEY